MRSERDEKSWGDREGERGGSPSLGHLFDTYVPPSERQLDLEMQMPLLPVQRPFTAPRAMVGIKRAGRRVLSCILCDERCVCMGAVYTFESYV